VSCRASGGQRRRRDSRGAPAVLDVSRAGDRASALVSVADRAHAARAARSRACDGRRHARGARATARRWRMSWAVWITGRPGSGKTAIAAAAAELLRERGVPVRVLELDAIRAHLVPAPEYSEAERELVYRALGYIAARLTDAAVPVIVDATAHRRRWR